MSAIITYLLGAAGAGLLFAKQIKSLLDRLGVHFGDSDGAGDYGSPEAAERAAALRNADRLIEYQQRRGDESGEQLARKAASQLFQLPAKQGGGCGDQA